MSYQYVWMYEHMMSKRWQKWHLYGKIFSHKAIIWLQKTYNLVHNMYGPVFLWCFLSFLEHDRCFFTYTRQLEGEKKSNVCKEKSWGCECVTWRAILATLAPIRGAQLIGAHIMVHRASGTGVWGHRRSRLLASKLGTRCIALHVRCKS